MKRHTFAMKVKDGQMNNFRKKLGEIWPVLTAFLDMTEKQNFSIWNAENLVFGYYEDEEVRELSVEEKQILNGIEESIEDCIIWLSKPEASMRLMYHNFGVVRKDKSLIRHRVFMTKLKPGCEEEYKARHDKLVQERGEKIEPGPDSNFSIWSAGGYIFGYDEIDTTMETEETKEERETTIAWETRQLEIMDWITNDVDWMTGTCHASVKRLAWYR